MGEKILDSIVEFRFFFQEIAHETQTLTILHSSLPVCTENLHPWPNVKLRQNFVNAVSHSISSGFEHLHKPFLLDVLDLLSQCKVFRWYLQLF